jgi:glycosyltransferase involved in cell wall biosynthesis
MKIVFYHELPFSAGFGIKEVLSGESPSSGGMGRIWLAVVLAKLGHEVVVFHRATQGPPLERTLGVICIRVTSDDDFVARLKRMGEVDSLVVNYYDHLPALLVKMAGVKARKVLWAGCNPPLEWCDLLDQVRLHRMVCVSDICREPYRLHRNFQWVDYIHTSMNGSVPIPPPAVPLVGSVAFLGALREEKGFHHVLRAWPLVRASVPEARLFVCGSVRVHLPDSPVGRTGVLEPEFERQHLDPWLGPSRDWRKHGVDFLYPLSKPALLERLAQTTVGIVNPNLTGSVETYCLSAVEMQACGCPCIGGGVGGLLETISNEVSGFHLRTQRAEELADRIVQILRNTELRTRLSQGALQHSAHLASSAREAQDWVRVFNATLLGIPSKAKPKWLMDTGRSLGLGKLKCLLNGIRHSVAQR